MKLIAGDPLQTADYSRRLIERLRACKGIGDYYAPLARRAR